MDFKVFTPRRNPPKTIGPAFVLIQDKWNDFSFRTQYQLYFVGEDEIITLIGSVKILKKGQTESDDSLITNDFQELNDDFCSVGQSLDYYQRFSELPDQVREIGLISLRDIVHSPAISSVPTFSR